MEALLLKDKKIVLPECGGDAARSAYYFLKNYGIKNNRIIAIDANKKALRYWKEILNVEVLLEEEFELDYEKHIIFPCDEYYREKIGYMGQYNFCPPGFTSTKLCDKREMSLIKISDWISDDYIDHKFIILSHVWSPLPWKKYVQRKNRSSGSKSLKIDLGKNIDTTACSIVTEYIEFEQEYVIDFIRINSVISSEVENNLAICARETYNLQNGADTHVRIISSLDENEKPNFEYVMLRDIVWNLTNALSFRGIGNIQIGKKGRNYYFIEMSPRISGASYLNLYVDWNPLYALHKETMSGLSFIPKEKIINTKFLLPFNAENW